jgi:hypothetical protein
VRKAGLKEFLLADRMAEQTVDLMADMRVVMKADQKVGHLVEHWADCLVEKMVASTVVTKVDLMAPMRAAL